MHVNNKKWPYFLNLDPVTAKIPFSLAAMDCMPALINQKCKNGTSLQQNGNLN